MAACSSVRELAVDTETPDRRNGHIHLKRVCDGAHRVPNVFQRGEIRPARGQLALLCDPTPLLLRAERRGCVNTRRGAG